MRRLTPLFFALLAFPLAAQERVHQDLAALGRIWGIARYAHPWIGSHPIDLDAAARNAIDRVRNREPLGTVVDDMLSVLRDDATFVSTRCTDSTVAPIDRSLRDVASGVIYLSALNEADLKTRQALHGARAAIVDLRPQPGRCTAPALAPELVPLLFRERVPGLSHRMVAHRGYRAQSGSSPFLTQYVVQELDFLMPSDEATVARVVFVVDEHSTIPAYAAALVAHHSADLVSVGTFPAYTAFHFTQVALPNDNRVATIRTSELVEDGRYDADPSPRMTLQSTATDDEVRAAALQLATPWAGKRRSSNVLVQPMPAYAWQPDTTDTNTPYPDVTHRILGAFRLWNIIQNFAGDRDAVTTWDEHFAEGIARVEAAQSRSEYELALAETLANVQDNQARVSAQTVDALRGLAAPPFQLLSIEGKPVVVRASGTVKPGDELLRIDGHDVAERIQTLERYAPRRAVIRDLPNGATGSQSVFTFRRPDGSQYDVTLPRGAQNTTVPGKAWRIVDGNIALVDMSMLAPSDVGAMLDEVAATRAMVFDLRNGTAGAGEAIATRMISGIAMAWVTRVPLVVGGSQLPSEGEQVVEGTHRDYAGRLLALVDARVDGNAEREALMLQSVGARLTGTPTAGASGTTSSLVVPGNIPVAFTAADLRPYDGARMQSIGAKPDHEASPTIRGLGDGRDEVLEAAVASLPDY